MKTIHTDKKSSYISFKIGREQFAISVGRVLEILIPEHLTRIPNTSAIVAGVMDFRGVVVPVLDMNLQFNILENENKGNMVVIVEIFTDGNKVLVGLMVDEVTNVLVFEHDSLRAVPDLGKNYNPEFLEGMVDINNEFIMVLDVDKILGASELTEIKSLEKV